MTEAPEYANVKGLRQLQAPRRPPSNILMFAMGSAGDVHPIIAVGKALRERGHPVLFVANSYFETAVRGAGLEFLSGGTTEEYLRTTEDPNLWKIGKGFRVLFEVMLNSMRDFYRIVAEHHALQQTLVIAPSSALGARLANEKLGVPLVNIHLQPLVLRSLNEQPGLAVPAYLKPVLRPARRMWLAALDRWILDPPLLPSLNAFRAELGLPAIKRVMNGWMHSPEMVIGLFPDWFAQPQPDWPPQVRLTGFPFYDEAGTRDLPPDLAGFIESGEPPIVFTLGTARRFAQQFFAASAETCRVLGRRGLLLSQFCEQIPATLPNGVRHFNYVPFSAVLPKCAAIVHHGGIGTIAQALRAGIPQLIVPSNFDQPGNAARLKTLGVGDSIRPKAYNPELASRRLEIMLQSDNVAQCCKFFAGRFKGSDPLRDTCELIESVMDGERANKRVTATNGI